MGYVVVDLDNTLCDSTHRVHHVQNKDFNKFHEESAKDKPNMDVAAFCQLIYRSTTLVGVTGRNERYRAQTVDWLREWEIPMAHLLMRPDTDFTPDHILKRRLLEDWFGSWEEVLNQVWFALDDRDKVVEAFRANGLPCWQVRPGSY